MSEPVTMKCEEALRLLAEYLDGELHGRAQADLERHLEICRGCFSRAEFERRLKARLGALSEVEPPPAIAERIRSLIESFPV